MPPRNGVWHILAQLHVIGRHLAYIWPPMRKGYIFFNSTLVLLMLKFHANPFHIPTAGYD
jgi:hypothetical protein